ncbi:MAG: AAA family ATPase [Rhodocyclaceae bacterium]|nr:AAA family ATPase [Rhodocyclaceae bacterium]
MFHIKQLELVHWDFWRRFSLPLDAQIITIVGPNGSGKTTLLDALRTLFALRCSGKRDFRRYVRRADRSFAWIRAVVANQPGPSGRRPFFPCLHDEVTLLCRIRRAGGDWTRDYAILDGDVAIESVEDGAADWAGLRDYQNRLAWGGLTPAIAKVLSLEQGDTDKLCEYSPKALLELVFDVFGDKEVLDNYAAAREEQRNAERELDELGLDLARLSAQAEAKRLEADRYLEWKQLHDEAGALEGEIVPRLEAAELLRTARAERGELALLKRERLDRRAELQTQLDAIARLATEREAAEADRARLREAETVADRAHLDAHDRLRDVDKILAERDALRARVAAEHGQDAVALEQQHERAETALTTLRGEERAALTEFESRTAELRDARTRSGPPGDPEVGRFRAILNDAGIDHLALAETVELTDPAWQSALEAVLRPYRHVLLLERTADRHQAWALGERERFRHFVVPEREAAAPPRPGSLAEVVRFTAAVPRWLVDLLGRIRRVDSVEAARELPPEVEWLTRDGYHRERRGARHLGRPRDFHFGELARQARITALEQDVAALDARLASLRPQRDAAEKQLSALRQRLLGLQSAQLLAANADHYAAAEAAIGDARVALASAERARGEVRSSLEERRDTLHGIDIELDRRQRARLGLEQRIAAIVRDSGPRRHGQAERLLALRRRRREMKAEWLAEVDIAAIAERYDGAAGARRELQRLQARLADGDWVTDAAVMTLSERLRAEVDQRDRDYRQRQGYCATARHHTDEARAAYIAKLRATVRQYGKNLRALGELAHVGVECNTPMLDNDDLSVSQAGLDVRFDFDRKGAVGLNDGEASGGQQVMKSLILLIALLMDEARPGGFVFIDEPFAHLDVANIDRVGSFLRATRAQYLITTPVTHNANVFEPAQLTLVTRKKPPADSWAPPIGVMLRERT